MPTSKQTLKTIFILSFVSFIYIVTQSCAPKNLVLTKIEGKQIAVDSTMATDAAIEAYVAPYRERLESEMNTVLAYTPIELTRERNEPETPLGNFLADLCYHKGNKVFNSRTCKNIDFVLLNIGGVRASIGKGDVYVRNAYEVMPFENSLVVAELTYDKVQELFQYYGVSGSAHPISKHLKLVFNGKTLESATLNGAALNPNQTYFVLTNDYLINGGDNMNFFLNPVSTTVLDYKVRAALLDELHEIDTIQSGLDGRVVRK